MRSKGDKLETKISRDLGINKTTNSGAKYDNADLANRKLMVEAKVKGKPSLSVPKSELNKLILQAIKHNKEWAYIQECESGTYVVLDYNFFVQLLEESNYLKT